MRSHLVMVIALLSLSVLASDGHAHPTYIGYSGAPGSHGRCASSCHGSTGGTVQISGFPTEYVPGEIYAVTIAHSGGSAIKQFNGSCRVGTGSDNAGVISAGTNTVTYSTSGETNGVHLSAQDLDSGTFDWTAPPAGTGEVRLYIAGHQGSYSGANTTLVLSATEQTTDVFPGDLAGTADLGLLVGNYPNPFTARTVIGYTLPREGLVGLEIFNLSGRRLETCAGEQSSGYHEFVWDASGRPSGVYFIRVQADGRSETRSMLLAR